MVALRCTNPSCEATAGCTVLYPRKGGRPLYTLHGDVIGAPDGFEPADYYPAVRVVVEDGLCRRCRKAGA